VGFAGIGDLVCVERGSERDPTHVLVAVEGIDLPSPLRARPFDSQPAGRVARDHAASLVPPRLRDLVRPDRQYRLRVPPQEDPNAEDHHREGDPHDCRRRVPVPDAAPGQSQSCCYEEQGEEAALAAVHSADDRQVTLVRSLGVHAREYLAALLL
jgi:hypothetical protein